MAETRPAEREKQQRRILEIIEAIYKHSAELGELADELDVFGCDCERSPTRPDAHPITCPVAMAWTARNMAEGRAVDRPQRGEAKNIRHLTDPFLRPDGRS